MVTLKIGRHKVEAYDTIDEMPVVRFQKFQKLLLVDAGIGSDIAAFDQRIERVRRFLAGGKADKAAQELENMRQAVYFIQAGVSPRHRAFAALVSKVDGLPADISDEGLARTAEILGDAPVGDMRTAIDAVKKKIDEDLMTYFPRLFNDSEVKEYFDLMRKRTLAILEGIAAGSENPVTDEVEKMTTDLMTHSIPRSFSGPEGVEVRHDRQFEDLCLLLSEQLHIQPKGCTVLEFYNAFEFIQQRAKDARVKARQ